MILDVEQHHSLNSISQASTIKDGELFLLMDGRGEMPVNEGHGLGLYMHDMRFLSGYTLRFAGLPFEGLSVISEEGNQARFELGNPPLTLSDGTEIDKLLVGAECQREIDGQNLTLSDRIQIKSYLDKAISLPVTLSFDAHFRDIFQVRGLYPDERGQIKEPYWRDGVLVFSYQGLDDVMRQTRIAFSPEPTHRSEKSVEYDLQLQARATLEIQVTISVREGGDETDHTPRSPFIDRRSKYCHLSSSSFFVQRLLERSFADLRLLLNRRDDFDYYAAGVPWFAVVFGRDSLLTAMMTLAFEPSIAESTLRLLATLQGREYRESNEEEPGRIPHELRCGELARSGRLAKSPDYGTVDATPLYLLLFRELARWTGKTDLFLELEGSVERALAWIDTRMEKYDGWLSYESTSKDACNHQGWKDVDGGIPCKDGRNAEPPIALVEVQGLVYAAWLGCAELYQMIGEEDKAAGLTQKAQDLRRRFNRDFWVKEEEFLALALEKGKASIDVVTSNMGQALWTGIVDPEYSQAIADRLLGAQLFSGWGIRTLSAQESTFSPIGYHTGGVWPHDNALIAAGLKRYSHHEQADRVIDAMIQAAFHFPLLRLPELFCGFSRETHSVPVTYPTACSPQAWAAAAIPSMLATALGLEVDAFEQRLLLRHPRLPSSVPDLQVRGLKVGAAKVDLSFHRTQGHTQVSVDRIDGECEVRVDLDTSALLEA